MFVPCRNNFASFNPRRNSCKLADRTKTIFDLRDECRHFVVRKFTLLRGGGEAERRGGGEAGRRGGGEAGRRGGGEAGRRGGGEAGRRGGGEAGTRGHRDVGLMDAGTWDSGTPGRGDAGTWDAGTRGRGDAGTWDSETRGRLDVGHGDLGREDVMNKQHLNFCAEFAIYSFRWLNRSLSRIQAYKNSRIRKNKKRD